MRDLKAKTLLIGIGNCGRGDDGLGWAFLDEFKKRDHLPVEFIYKYQLNIEDAETISKFSTVIFIDACSGDLEKGYSYEKCLPVDSFEFTTHALSPGVIISLCQNLYDLNPDVYLLKIQGTEWDLKEGLSKKADKNLHGAMSYFLKRKERLQTQ